MLRITLDEEYLKLDCRNEVEFQRELHFITEELHELRVGVEAGTIKRYSDPTCEDLKELIEKARSYAESGGTWYRSEVTLEVKDLSSEEVFIPTTVFELNDPTAAQRFNELAHELLRVNNKPTGNGFETDAIGGVFIYRSFATGLEEEQ